MSDDAVGANKGWHPCDAGRAVQVGLFGLGPWDAPTLVMAVLIIAAVTAVAAYFPARRATKVDPIVALRYE
jgi:ABC-type antimicrobial peptide transport system permease subunit